MANREYLGGLLSAFLACGLLFAASACGSDDDDDNGADKTGGGGGQDGGDTGTGGADDGTGGGDDGNAGSTGDGPDGTAGGDTGTGGGGGGAEVPTCEDLPKAESEPLIEDFEDGDGTLLENDSRAGSWYTFQDSSEDAVLLPEGDFAPEAEGYGDSGYSAKLSSETGGFTDYGVGMGTNFVAASDGCGYDASAFGGVSFCLKGTADLKIWVQIKIPEAIPVDEGGLCDEPQNDGCYNNPISEMITLTTDWECHEILWEDFGPATYGDPRSWDSSNIIGFELRIDEGAEDAFAVYLDDLTFIGEGGTSTGEGGAGGQPATDDDGGAGGAEPAGGGGASGAEPAAGGAGGDS